MTRLIHQLIGNLVHIMYNTQNTIRVLMLNEIMEPAPYWPRPLYRLSVPRWVYWGGVGACVLVLGCTGA